MADYAKLKHSQVLDHGGVAVDFDLIFINSTKLCDAQRFSECVLVNQGGKIKISFFSCVKDASYIKAMVESYHKDCRSQLVYNVWRCTNKAIDRQK